MLLGRVWTFFLADMGAGSTGEGSGFSMVGEPPSDNDESGKSETSHWR